MLVSIVAVALAAAAFALVGYPLLRERREQAVALDMPDDFELALEDLTAQRDATYSAIKELDFDQEMGNLPEPDYRALREQYRRKAATILRDLDELRDGAQPAGKGSQAAPAAGNGQEIDGGDDVEREVLRKRRARRAAQRPCPSCGAYMRLRDHFCSSCGALVSSGCPNCGAPHQPEDRFCAGCGGALAGVVVS